MNAVPSEASCDSDGRAFRSLSWVNARLPSTTEVSSGKSAQKPHHYRYRSTHSTAWYRVPMRSRSAASP